jgi:hypothetical protein
MDHLYAVATPIPSGDAWMGDGTLTVAYFVSQYPHHTSKKKREGCEASRRGKRYREWDIYTSNKIKSI